MGPRGTKHPWCLGAGQVGGKKLYPTSALLLSKGDLLVTGEDKRPSSLFCSESPPLGQDHQPGTLGWPGLQGLASDFSGGFERDRIFGFSLWPRSWGSSSKEEISKSLSASESYREGRGRGKCILTMEDEMLDRHGGKMQV